MQERGDARQAAGALDRPPADGGEGTLDVDRRTSEWVSSTDFGVSLSNVHLHPFTHEAQKKYQFWLQDAE